MNTWTYIYCTHTHTRSTNRHHEALTRRIIFTKHVHSRRRWIPTQTTHLRANPTGKTSVVKGVVQRLFQLLECHLDAPPLLECDLQQLQPFLHGFAATRRRLIFFTLSFLIVLLLCCKHGYLWQYSGSPKRWSWSHIVNFSCIWHQ